MNETASLQIGETVLTLPVAAATEGPPAMDVSTLLRDAGVVTLDYGFANTAATRSSITYIDGDAGILRYRGYPIEQLADAIDVPRDRLPAHLRRAADGRAAGRRG